MPVDVDPSEYIQDFIQQFQNICKKSCICSTYKSGIVAITQHSSMLNQISQDGNYWTILDNAVQNDIIFKSYNCLSEFLLDQTISQVIDSMFGLKDDATTWPDSVKIYAFGN